MKFEVNISKKYVFFLAIFAAVLLIGVVYAAKPNPGHDPSEIGEGTFSGDANSNYIFPGRVDAGQYVVYKASPELWWADSAKQGSVGGMWRMIAQNQVLRFDVSKTGQFGTFDTLLSLDGITESVNVGSLNLAEGFEGISSAEIFSFQNKPIMSLYIDSVSQKSTVNIKESLRTPEACLGTDCRNNWTVQLSSMPVGSWCGWTQGATKTLCGGMDPFNGCPTGNGYNYTKRTVIPQNGAGISVCIRTA